MTSHTGFVWPVAQGEITELSDFALNCARSFGALYSLRDAPTGEIPEVIKPCCYYAEYAAEVKERLEWLRALTPSEYMREAEKESRARAKADRAHHEQAKVERERCSQMYALVEDWIPPTEEHTELRDFMLSQLRQSIDADLPEVVDAEPLDTLDCLHWYSQAIAKAIAEVKRCEAEYAEEVQRAKNKTEWLRALRASLPKKPCPKKP